jgi:Putative auto-transporter adhesin, head GIN domain
MSTAPTSVSRGHVRNLLHFGARAIVVVLAVAGVVLIANRLGDEQSSSDVVRGSGTPASQLRNLPSFEALELAGSTELTVRIGDQAVVVEADDNLVGRVTTEVRAGTLVVGTDGSFTTSSPMRVDVTVPTLNALVLSGSGIMVVEDISAERLRVRVPGSGLLRANGTAELLDAGLSGSGDVQLENLVARDVVATLSGSGRLQVHATRSLDASVPGSGIIFYGGNPADVAKSVSGTGAILGS